MIRTQILLDEDLKRDLQEYAKQHNKSLSETVRILTRKQLEKQKPFNRGLGALLRMLDDAPNHKGGPKDLSEKIDDYLYKV